MFNLFDNFGNSKKYNLPTVDEVWRSDEIEHSKHSYTVGMNESGETILNLQTDTGITTLRLSKSGTVSLIRLLEATLPIEDEK